MNCLHAFPSSVVHLCVLLRNLSNRFVVSIKNHLEERLLDRAQVRTPYSPPPHNKITSSMQRLTRIASRLLQEGWTVKEVRQLCRAASAVHHLKTRAATSGNSVSDPMRICTRPPRVLLSVWPTAQGGGGVPGFWNKCLV